MGGGLRILRTAPAGTPVLLCLSPGGELGPWAAGLAPADLPAADGFHVLMARRLEEAVALARSCRPDLVILGPGLPGPDEGRLSDPLALPFRRLPVVGLRPAGAPAPPAPGWAEPEDLLPGDLPPGATAIRLRAVLRRARPEALTARLLWRGIELRQDERRVAAGGRVLQPSFQAFNLLALLMEEPGRVWPREELRLALLGPGAAGGPQSLDRIARTLRGGLAPALGRDPIESVRGEGFRLA